MQERWDHAATYALVALLTIFVFLVDLATPLGVEASVGYLVPLVLVARSPRPRPVLVFLAACTALIGIGFSLDHPAVPFDFVVLNRLLSVAAIWAVGLLIIQRNRAADALQQAAAGALQASEAANQALRANQEQLAALSLHLVESVEDERRALARELHDEAGQSLTALQLGLGRLANSAGDGQAVRSGVQELQALAGSVMEQLHRLAADLRPVSLDRYGLVPALEQYAETITRQSGLQVEFLAVGLDQGRLPAQVESTVYRVVQEALTNVARHAHATRAGVILERRSDAYVAIVEDDGVGFDVEAALQGGRLGLLGMRERTALLGGSLHIESEPGKGSTVVMALPCRGCVLAAPS